MTAGKSIAALPHALRDRDELTRHFGDVVRRSSSTTTAR